MTRALFSISQDVLSSEKQWRKRQLFVNVVDSRSELDQWPSCPSPSFLFFFFPLLSKGGFSAHIKAPLQTPQTPGLGFWLDSLGSTHLLSVGELFLMWGEICLAFVRNLSLSDWSSHIPSGVRALVLEMFSSVPSICSYSLVVRLEDLFGVCSRCLKSP